jgi:hypothetical protein
MKKMLITIFIFITISVSTSAEEGFNKRPIINNLNMPTGFTLNKGEFTVGIGTLGYGISDRIQISTNILLYLFQVYNGDLKIQVINSGSFSLAAGLDMNYINLKVYGEDTGFTAFSPYIALSPKLSDKTTLHFSGRYSFFHGDTDITDADVEAVSIGTSFSTGIEHSLSPKTKFLTEAGYDATFKGFRMGGAVLFGGKKFRLKLGINYFKPKGTGGFTIPVIGLWWRFNG